MVFLGLASLQSCARVLLVVAHWLLPCPCPRSSALTFPAARPFPCAPWCWARRCCVPASPSQRPLFSCTVPCVRTAIPAPHGLPPINGSPFPFAPLPPCTPSRPEANRMLALTCGDLHIGISSGTESHAAHVHWALGDWQGHCTSWVDRVPWAARTWACVLSPLWALCHRKSAQTNSENALRSGLVFAQGFMRGTEKGGIDADKARSIHLHSRTDPIGVQCMHGATRAPTCLQVGPGWQSPPKQRARTASLLAPQLLGT